MSELKRHKLTFKILAPVISVFLKWRFHYEYDDLKKIEGPYLLVANHNLELDPAVVGVAAGKQLYFVASEHILRKGLGTWLLMTFFRPIIHMKGRQGVQTVRQMLQTLRDGHSVCIFPEGNRSFNGLTGEMLPAIGKVARCCGVKLLTYRIEGGYLTQPRWCLTLRRGRLRGRLIGEYSPETLKRMTDQQVNRIICDDLYEDAYQTQMKEPVAFRGRNLALGLESTIYTCPDCHTIGALHSRGDRFFCDCGFEAVYDVYGELTDKKGIKYTVTKLDEMQQNALLERLLACPAERLMFSDKVTLYEIDGDHRLVGICEGVLEAYPEKIVCCGRTVLYRQLQGMAIYSRSAMILHIQGQEGHIEIKGDKSFSALKYLQLYHTKEKVQ